MPDPTVGLEVGGTKLYTVEGQMPFFWTSGFAVDADGAPRAYHPGGRAAGALDATANAGHPGNWWGIVTDGNGDPVIQGDGDPAPGFYVSTTALVDGTRPRADPNRYVDASTVPYVSLPSPAIKHFGVTKGDLAMVLNGKNGQFSSAIVADVGPATQIGEGSVALATALGLSGDASHGGTSSGIVWVVFPGSAASPAWPRALDEIASSASALLGAFGGVAPLLTSLPQFQAVFAALTF